MVAYFCSVLSKKAKYAINALVYLARQPKDEPIPVAQISEEQNIPRKFLEAILLDLKKNGILISKQGKSGGYRLHLPPEKINMAEVMRLFDGAIALLPCVTYKFYERCEECRDEETCGIRAVFLEIRNQTVNRLKEATLASIIADEKAMRKGDKL